MKVTNETILYWIRENLGKHIRRAVSLFAYKKMPYITEELLAGIVRREVGHKLVKYIRKQLKNPEKWTFEFICRKMRGDWWKGKWHGHGFWQIDDRSYPEFVKEKLGFPTSYEFKWQDPYECCKQAIKCLEEKREYLKFEQYDKEYSIPFFERMIIVAYNCGQKNVIKALKKDKDIDYYTYNRDYSKSVLEFAEQYKRLFIIDNMKPAETVECGDNMKKYLKLKPMEVK